MSAKKTRPKKKTAARKRPAIRGGTRERHRARKIPGKKDARAARLAVSAKLAGKLSQTLTEFMRPFAARLDAIEACGRDRPQMAENVRIGAAGANTGATNLNELAAENRGRAGVLVERLSSLVHRLGLPSDPRPSAESATAARDSLLNVLVDTKHTINAAHLLLDALESNT